MNTIVYSVRILHTHIRYIHNIICMWSQFEGKKRASALDEQARIQVSIHTCIFHVLIYVYVCACMFEYYTCGVGNNIHVCMYVCTHMYAHVTHIVVRIRASSASCRMLRTCVHNYAHIYIYIYINVYAHKRHYWLQWHLWVLMYVSVSHTNTHIPLHDTCAHNSHTFGIHVFIPFSCTHTHIHSLINVCIYVCVCIYIHKYTHTYTYTHIPHICVLMFPCMDACIPSSYTYMHIHYRETYVCMYARTFVCLCIHMRAAAIQIYAYTCIYACIHASKDVAKAKSPTLICVFACMNLSVFQLWCTQWQWQWPTELFPTRPRFWPLLIHFPWFSQTWVMADVLAAEPLEGRQLFFAFKIRILIEYGYMKYQAS